MENQEAKPEQNQQANQPLFVIEKLYVKDLSIELPNAPRIFLEQGAPQIELQIQTHDTALGENAYDVVLTVTATAKLDDKTIFLVEVGQAGIFRIVNVPEQELEPLLKITCPNILQSYAREVLSSATTRAGFPPFLLQPINFEALYVQYLQEKDSVARSTTLQ
ncbi:MAG: protein-export chaperone SecB [Zoogloeaceae bacterium]|jgi:preprotein translocase subunit SecB|nr:protein-export chaperone SecB [Zoogloeaceae bacterium]